MATTRQTKSTGKGAGKSPSKSTKSKGPKKADKPAATAKPSRAPAKRAGSKGAGKSSTGSKSSSRSRAAAGSKGIAGAVVSPEGLRARTKSPAVSRNKTREDSARDLALAIANAALDKKAESVEVIDIRGRVDYADFLVVMSGRSDRHVVAVAQGIEAALKERGHRCLGVEGLPQGQWVLMDFADVIAHVFHGERRGYYDLEGLWLDADRVPFESGVSAAVSVG